MNQDEPGFQDLRGRAHRPDRVGLGPAAESRGVPPPSDPHPSGPGFDRRDEGGTIFPPGKTGIRVPGRRARRRHSGQPHLSRGFYLRQFDDPDPRDRPGPAARGEKTALPVEFLCLSQALQTTDAGRGSSDRRPGTHQRALRSRQAGGHQAVRIVCPAIRGRILLRHSGQRVRSPRSFRRRRPRAGRPGGQISQSPGKRGSRGGGLGDRPAPPGILLRG